MCVCIERDINIYIYISPDRQTDRQTDRHADREVVNDSFISVNRICWALAVALRSISLTAPPSRLEDFNLAAKGC